MDREALRPRTRRKLNRSQIVDILERNIALYKDEENFVQYLVDLTIYLMECEYEGSSAEGANATAALKCINNTTAHDLTATPAPNLTPAPAEGMNGKKLNSRFTNESLLKHVRVCPYCGAVVGDVVICPSCRNMTR